jgi:uncharacterized protein (TIGR03067 family)
MKCQAPLALVLGLLIVTDAFGVADLPAKKKDPREDWVQIQGTWKATFWEESEEKRKGTITIVIKGDRWALTVNMSIYKGALKIDPSQKVKTLDASVTQGAGSVASVQGIYRLVDNTWTVCWTIAYGMRPRPNEWTTRPNSNWVLFICKKVKP